MTADQRAALADQFDKASRIAGAEPVAVVGNGCRFPGGVAGPAGYWEFLANGTDAVTEVPSDRWDGDAFYDPDPMAPGRMRRSGAPTCPTCRVSTPISSASPRARPWRWIRSSGCCWR